MRVTALNLHPVKSTAVRPVSRAMLRRWGCAGDRRWMAVDEDGAMLTARTEAGLFRVTADVPETGSDVPLRLTAEGQGSLDVEVPRGPTRPVEVFRSRQEACDAGDEAAAWLSRVLGRPARLLYCPDPGRREVDQAYARPGDHVAFADGFPVLLAGEASLARVNTWVEQAAVGRGESSPEPLAMARFRPNVVVDHPEPFAEDAWRVLRIQDIVLRVVKPCARCVVTGLDPASLERGKEPLATLARHRRIGGKMLFGQNLVPDGEGVVRVGDEVSVLE